MEIVDHMRHSKQLTLWVHIPHKIIGSLAEQNPYLMIRRLQTTVTEKSTNRRKLMNRMTLIHLFNFGTIYSF
jgi:hypothetical protein